MPHQCTDCGRQFDDGSKEMLSGCPECGGNKFQFLPAAQSDETAPDPPGEGVGTDVSTDRSVARTVGNAATAVRDLVGSSSDHARDPGFDESDDPVGSTATTEPSTSVESNASATAEPDTTPAAESSSSPTSEYASSQQPRPDGTAASMAETEDEAQASARSDVISPDELPPSPQQESSWPDEGPTEAETDDSESERPDLSELRAELNEQFESIKVLEPGQYELNLMELFDREEYIVALQEDGKYTVQVPEDWKQ